MSYSSLFLIKPDTSFGQRINYSNSWLFAPVSWDLQLNSYITDEIRTPHGFAKSLINSQDANRLFSLANDALNNSTCTADRIVWELSNQQIFSTKDKDVVSECIFEYYDNHKNDTLLYDKEKIDKMVSEGQIEIVPFAFMRGRTFPNSFVIVDECQNITHAQTEMMLGRLGKGGKMIFLRMAISIVHIDCGCGTLTAKTQFSPPGEQFKQGEYVYEFICLPKTPSPQPYLS